MTDCPRCEGTGTVIRPYRDTCSGQRQTVEIFCGYCGGGGRVTEREARTCPPMKPLTNLGPTE